MTASSDGILIVEIQDGILIARRPTTPSTAATSFTVVSTDNTVPDLRYCDARPTFPQRTAPADPASRSRVSGRDRRDPRLLRHAMTRWRKAA